MNVSNGKKCKVEFEAISEDLRGSILSNYPPAKIPRAKKKLTLLFKTIFGKGLVPFHLSLNIKCTDRMVHMITGEVVKQLT